jgi:hypothetical protein
MNRIIGAAAVLAFAAGCTRPVLETPVKQTGAPPGISEAQAIEIARQHIADSTGWGIEQDCKAYPVENGWQIHSWFFIFDEQGDRRFIPCAFHDVYVDSKGNVK